MTIQSDNYEILAKLLKEGVTSGKLSSLTDDAQKSLVSFYEIMLKENQVQNLTRLASPNEFCDYHLADTFKLLETGWVAYPALDLGSGAGIPGVLAALIDKKAWILAESEKRKAEYLQRAVDTLGIQGQVQVVPDRAEAFLKAHKVGSIVVRAVGTVEKIYGWIRKCSTWNNLILLKGPNWEEEWKVFLASPFGSELKVTGEVEYQVGPEQKTRKIVRVERVVAVRH
ncbi:MAG: RsmG family class I SAM-dependent methyltransferase [Bdellovibrionia bacterium]